MIKKRIEELELELEILRNRLALIYKNQITYETLQDGINKEMKDNFKSLLDYLKIRQISVPEHKTFIKIKKGDLPF